MFSDDENQMLDQADSFLTGLSWSRGWSLALAASLLLVLFVDSSASVPNIVCTLVSSFEKYIQAFARNNDFEKTSNK